MIAMSWGETFAMLLVVAAVVAVAASAFGNGFLLTVAVIAFVMCAILATIMFKFDV